MVSVRAGAQAKFEDGYRRHLGWHRSHHDPLAWCGWIVSDGKRAGYFIDASVGEPFAAFDHRADVEQDGADFRLNVSPYVTPQAQLAYEWLPNSVLALRWKAISLRTACRSLTSTCGPGRRAFRACAAGCQACARCNGRRAGTYLVSPVTGGDTSQYMLMVARTNWASYDVYRKDVADLLATDPNALRDFADAVRSSYTESWKHHADLSNLP